MATRRERQGLPEVEIAYKDNILPTPNNIMDSFCNVWNSKKIGKFKVICGGNGVLPNLWYKAIWAILLIVNPSIL